MASIHPTAVVEPGARLAQGVRVGPYCVVGSQVELHDGVELISHVAVAGRTVVGAEIFCWILRIPHDRWNMRRENGPCSRVTWLWYSSIGLIFRLANSFCHRFSRGLCKRVSLCIA